MASFMALQTTIASCGSLSCSASGALHQPLQNGTSSPKGVVALRKEAGSARAQYRETNGSRGIPLFRKLSVSSPMQVLKASGNYPDYIEDSSSPSYSSDSEREQEGGSTSIAPVTWNSSSELQQEGIVLSKSAYAPLQKLTQDAAMGLVLRAAVGTSWTTGSGLEGPTEEAEKEEEPELKFPDLSKSPRRRMRVAFTCNVCGERTIRAINPLAYTDGTVFVQCKGCDVFHKLVDNLNLFHEMTGKIYRGYDTPWYANDQPYDFLGGQYPLL